MPTQDAPREVERYAGENHCIAHWNEIRATLKPSVYVAPPPTVTITVTDDEAGDVDLFKQRRRVVISAIERGK